MFATTFAIVAIASTVVVNAAPIAKRDEPSGWATAYLEDYSTYHARYLALDCQDKHDTTFFDDCCHPLLASETLDSRASYCSPNATSSESAASYAATATSTDSADADVATEYGAATASVVSVYESLTSATPSATVDTTAVYTASSTSSDDWDDATATSTTSLDSLATALAAENNYAQPSSSSSEKAKHTPTSTYVAPTSTWTSEAAATTTASSSSGSGDVETGGYATYFYQNGNAGACGNVNSDSDYGIAIDQAGWWQDTSEASPYCGKQIQITNTNNGKQVTATVWDVCPTCDTNNSLDLSVGAFTAIASEADGMVPITWQWV